MSESLSRTDTEVGQTRKAQLELSLTLLKYPFIQVLRNYVKYLQPLATWYPDSAPTPQASVQAVVVTQRNFTTQTTKHSRERDRAENEEEKEKKKKKTKKERKKKGSWKEGNKKRTDTGSCTAIVVEKPATPAAKKHKN